RPACQPRRPRGPGRQAPPPPGGPGPAAGAGAKGQGGRPPAFSRRPDGRGHPGRLPKVPLMPTPFRTTRRVEFADTDMAGIVHFANFFRYMEAAEVEFLRSLGLSVKMAWEGQPLGFPRVAASCDYVKPARFEDLLGVAVRIDKIGRKSVTYAFEFSKEGEVVA